MIIIKPIKIKTCFYLLIPKTLAELMELKDDIKFKLDINYDGIKSIQYTEYKVKKKVKRRTRKKMIEDLFTRRRGRR